MNPKLKSQLLSVIYGFYILLTLSVCLYGLVGLSSVSDEQIDTKVSKISIKNIS